LILPFDAALAETARHQDRVHPAQRLDAFALQRFGVHIMNVHLGAGMMPA
jgi:hypothetical protein